MRGNTYLNVRDESNGVARERGVTGLPETFFITADGEVVGHVMGVISEERLCAEIAAAHSGRPVGSVSGGDQRSVRWSRCATREPAGRSRPYDATSYAA